MNPIYAIQHFNGKVWKTIYLTTFHEDAQETYIDISQASWSTLRLVEFTTDGFDFIATHARDFAVLGLHEGKDGRC